MIEDGELSINSGGSMDDSDEAPVVRPHAVLAATRAPRLLSAVISWSAMSTPCYLTAISCLPSGGSQTASEQSPPARKHDDPLFFLARHLCSNQLPPSHTIAACPCPSSRAARVVPCPPLSVSSLAAISQSYATSSAFMDQCAALHPTSDRDNCSGAQAVLAAHPASMSATWPPCCPRCLASSPIDVPSYAGTQPLQIHNPSAHFILAGWLDDNDVDLSTGR
jgi:hypothetical protein